MAFLLRGRPGSNSGGLTNSIQDTTPVGVAGFFGAEPKVGARQARTNLGFWDGIPLGYRAAHAELGLVFGGGWVMIVGGMKFPFTANLRGFAVRGGLFCLLLLPISGGLRAEPIAGRPVYSHSFDFETGALWQVRDSTPFNYRMIPSRISWRSPEVFHLDITQRFRLTIRHRVGLQYAMIQQGPESGYFAASFAPSIEWWHPGGEWGITADVGGGAGFIDSRGIEGGQGQDFTLHWYARLVAERMISESASVFAGGLFQHLSNGGQTDPNPGIDVLGFTAGFGLKF